jgi:hypothetical protein
LIGTPAAISSDACGPVSGSRPVVGDDVEAVLAFDGVGRLRSVDDFEVDPKS